MYKEKLIKEAKLSDQQVERRNWTNDSNDLPLENPKPRYRQDTVEPSS